MLHRSRESPCVYVMWCNHNDMLYIGQTRKKLIGRFNCHRRNCNLSKIMCLFQYGENYVHMAVLERINDISKLLERENYWIKHYSSNNYELVNRTGNKYFKPLSLSLRRECINNGKYFENNNIKKVQDYLIKLYKRNVIRELVGKSRLPSRFYNHLVSKKTLSCFIKKNGEIKIVHALHKRKFKKTLFIINDSYVSTFVNIGFGLINAHLLKDHKCKSNTYLLFKLCENKTIKTLKFKQYYNIYSFNLIKHREKLIKILPSSFFIEAVSHTFKNYTKNKIFIKYGYESIVINRV